jgi:hypothetical protein
MGWMGLNQSQLRPWSLPLRVIGGIHVRCGTPVTPLQLLILKGL